MSGDFTGEYTATIAWRLAACAGIEFWQAGKFLVKKVRERLRQLKNPEFVPGLSGVAEALDQAVASERLLPSSVEKYREVVALFAIGLDRSRHGPVRAEEIERFMEERALHGIGTGARRVDLAALRAVFDTMLGCRATTGMGYPERPEPVEGNSRDEAGRLLANAENDQDRLLVLLLNAAKLRPGQIAALQPRQIDLAHGLVALPRRKPGNFAVRRLPGTVLKLLKKPGIIHPGSTWIFESRRDPKQHLTVRALQKRLARMAANATVNATPTTLRKADSLDPDSQTVSAAKLPDVQIDLSDALPHETACQAPPATATTTGTETTTATRTDAVLPGPSRQSPDFAEETNPRQDFPSPPPSLSAIQVTAFKEGNRIEEREAPRRQANADPAAVFGGQAEPPPPPKTPVPAPRKQSIRNRLANLLQRAFSE